MSNPSGLLQAYMADDPNLITQPMGAENRSANGAPPEDVQAGRNDTQRTAPGTNATPETANPLGDVNGEDMEMTDPQDEPGDVPTGFGALFTGRGLIPTTWFGSRSDSETRKRKERSTSPEAATDGEDQSAGAAGAHKKLRATTSTVVSSGTPSQEMGNGAVDRGDSATHPSSETPEQSSGAQSMPGDLSLAIVGPSSSQSMVSVDPSAVILTDGGAHLSGNKVQATTTPSLTTDGLSVAATVDHPLVVTNSDRSYAGPTLGLAESSEGRGTPVTTTTPLGSPPTATTDIGPSRPLGDNRMVPAKDKAPLRDPAPTTDRPFKRIPINKPAAPAVHGPSGEALTDDFVPPPGAPVTPSTGASSASSSTTPNNSDPWLVLAQQFNGVQTEIRTMGTHMRTMSSNIGRLDNAMEVMSEQHTELMSVLRMSLQQSFNKAPPAGGARQTPSAGPPPAATAGQRPLVSAPLVAGPHSAGVSRSPAVPVTHQPPGFPRTAAPRHQRHATTSSHLTTQSSRAAPPSTSRQGSSQAQASSDDEMDVDGGEEADTEGEIPEPLPVLVKTSKLKLKGMPRPRDPVRKALLDDINLMVRKYMGREPDPDDDEDSDVLFFDEAKVPSRNEVGTFNGQGGQCCTIDNFRPDLLGTPRSTWNQSVAQVFAKVYVKEKTAKSKNVAEVERAFGVHMKTLINSYKTFQASQTANDAKRRTRRRYMRKSYAHQRRLLTVASHDGMKHHLWVIQALGVQGMSSDESEHEGTQVRYRRTTLAWRNPALETFFRVIDVFHGASRFTNGVDKSSKSGSHVHLRLPAQKISKRAAVPGLPEAAYDSAWLKGLSDFFRSRLNVSKVQYQFVHPPVVMKEMMQVLQPTPSDQTQQTPPAQ